MANNQFKKERLQETLSQIKEIQAAYQSVDPEENLHRSLRDPRNSHDGHLHFLSECIEVVVENHQVCLEIPLFGNICIPVPGFVPEGEVGSACLEICTTFGIPTGVKVTLQILKFKVSKSFGKC